MVNNELQRMWKEAMKAYWHFPEVSDENHENLSDVSVLSFTLDTSQIQLRSVTRLAK
jgi:hypothetical protein